MRTIVSILAALAGIALAGALSTPAIAGDVVQVRVYDMDFSVTPSGPPVHPTIKRGDTIRWVWQQGSMMHDSVSVRNIPEQWASELRFPPYSFDHTFTHLGRHWYYCTLHGWDNGNQTAGGMAGWIRVVDPLELDGPNPGVAGQQNTLRVEGLTPSTRVAFAYSLFSGQFVVGSPCLGMVANLDSPTLAGFATANSSGVATLTAFVPQAASGRTVRIQAFNVNDCVPSQVVVHRFP